MKKLSGLSTDYEGRCGNCHKFFGEGDLYCRYCGTKAGEGRYEPYDDIMQCVYGPPPETNVYGPPPDDVVVTSEETIETEDTKTSKESDDNNEVCVYGPAPDTPVDGPEVDVYGPAPDEG